MDKEPPSLQLKHFLPYRLNILSKRISDTLSKVYTQEFGISIPEWRVLVWLKNQPNLSAKEISTYYMDKTQVSRVTHQLEKRQLIQRQIDKNDCRSFQLSLTTAGKDLIDRIIPGAIAWEDELIQTLTASEFRNLMIIIEKLELQFTENGWANISN